MFAILLSAFVTCVVSLFLGQAALRLCGFSRWNWIAPAVGISLAMMIAVTAIHAPGRCATVAVVLGVLTIASTVWCCRRPEHRPPLRDLAAAAAVVLMVLVPYLAVERAGIPGVSKNNDLAMHLLWAEAVLSAKVQAVTPLPLDYPIGPHSMAAIFAKGLGIETDESFAGWAMALPILNAWIALVLFPRARWFGKLVGVTVVGMPFLIAAYYGEASFKEVLLAGIVLALVAFLIEARSFSGRGRWVPFAVLVGGVLSIYSIAGLPWPLLIGGAWLAIVAAGCLFRRGIGGLLAAARRELQALGIACGVLLVLLVPQIPRLAHFVSLRASVNGTGIETTDLGNLVGPLPGWEAFGVWNNPDFRLPSSPAFTGGMWTAFVLGLVLIGIYWAVKSGRWILPLAAAISMLIWAASGHSQSPYVTAKALVIATPLILALAALPLVERDVLQPPWWALGSVLALVLFCAVGWSDLRALRISPVGPTDYVSQLRSLRGQIEGEPTLFLGNDDFIPWELAGVPVTAPVVRTVQTLPIPSQKTWVAGRPLDFDSVNAAALNAARWVIAPREVAASAPPPQLHLVRETRNYSLWRRVGTVQDRSILQEGEMPGAVLRCGTSGGRRLLSQGGIAAVRSQPVVIPGPTILPGETVAVHLPLPAGAWELGAQYNSNLPVEVSGVGLRMTLAPNLEWLGPRWRVGVLRVPAEEGANLTLHVGGNPLTPATDSAALAQLIATRLGPPEHVVPLRKACGRYVDWYRSSSR
jgi:hypothetical protein